MNWKETIAGFWKTVGKNRTDNDPKQRTKFSGSMDTLTAAELAAIFWNKTREWPRSDGKFEEELRADTKLATDDFRNEMIYLRAFVDDFALHVGLEKAAPNVQKAVRDAYAEHLRSFAQQTACKPMPEGEWLGDSMMYLSTGQYPQTSINNDPIRNLKDRFQLFAEAIRRGKLRKEHRKDGSLGECLAKAFAGLCGARNLAFTMGVSSLVTQTLVGLVELLRAHSHQIRLD
jgi:hypothetical protein